MKFKIYKFEEVTSTNDVAIYLIKNKKKKYGFVYSKKQTNGRGRHGNKWISNYGNLFGSIFFPLKSSYPAFNEFSLISPILIHDVIKKLCKEKKISIKWPNDIFLNGKKICGILQEIITLKSRKFLIIGIGVNIVSSPNINKEYDATNIFKETKKNPSLKKLIKLITNSYEKFFNEIDSYKYLNFKKKIDLIASKNI
ncbi:MAG TPA: biotin--[acetyl-CoA-carboxylase] ligase [Candidatus Pelagibacter sp.]|jgi:BirA family biotin operon repressor/biotin-[acetyl-CoA-carboxylase] ligase|nr:biotin--[acetyl-CoA-carboxylase] ligase [Candidatus Pelagibacter sp.]